MDDGEFDDSYDIDVSDKNNKDEGK